MSSIVDLFANLNTIKKQSFSFQPESDEEDEFFDCFEFLNENRSTTLIFTVIIAYLTVDS